MENKILKKIFKEIAEDHDFIYAFNGWYKETSECIFCFDLMKSHFGNYYIVNFKVFIQGAFARRHEISKYLILNEVGDIDRQEPKEFEDALNLENLMSDLDRKEKLKLFFEVFITPFSNKALTKNGLIKLEEEKTIVILPPVKEEIKKMLKGNY